MAPLWLTLDRGNTTLDAMLHGDEPRRARLRSAADLAGFLAGAQPSRAFGVSVVPSGLAEAEVLLAGLGIALWCYGREIAVPMPVRYDTPATLGGDRVLGAYAAHLRFGRAVVVDCGSATTVNLVEADGAFCGGAIGPGLEAIAAGMALRTPHLPAVDPAAALAMPPRSSAAAVDAGALLTFCGGIERMVADMLAVAAGPAAVVLTGGHAEHYLRHGRLRPVVVPDLVHQGLLLAGTACGS